MIEGLTQIFFNFCEFWGVYSARNSVKDPDPDSGVFWIQIQGLKKGHKW